jgi:hypothetical protein
MKSIHPLLIELTISKKGSRFERSISALESIPSSYVISKDNQNSVARPRNSSHFFFLIAAHKIKSVAVRVIKPVKLIVISGILLPLVSNFRACTGKS